MYRDLLNSNENSSKKSPKFRKLEETPDCLTSRAGLIPFGIALDRSGIVDQIADTFADLRGSRKGINLLDVFKQILMYQVDGNYTGFSGFDVLKEEEAWCKLVDCNEIVNSHQLHRLLAKLNIEHLERLRPNILSTFLTYLQSSKPDEVILFLDSSVYDNDGAKLRSGVTPTYKKKCGYHCINLICNGMYLDTKFLPGKCSTNHDNVAIEMLGKAIPKIRKVLGQKIKIVVRMDSGYYDQKIFRHCDELGIGFVCAGKVFSDLTALAESKQFDGILKKESCHWAYKRFEDARGNWPKGLAYRALLLTAVEEGGQGLLGLKNRTILTNLSETEVNDLKLIELDHSRGTDELTHRAAKDFASERMPSLSFEVNCIWYQLQIISYNLLQLYKQDVLQVNLRIYTTTIRRKYLDIAGKITESARQTKLKVTRFVMETLNFTQIWKRAHEFKPLISV